MTYGLWQHTHKRPLQTTTTTTTALVIFHPRATVGQILQET
jgi:hypothetical protein